MGFTPQLNLTQRVVVGISDMAVTNSQSVILSTFALGSCVGVVLFDPLVKAAGLIHIMLPVAGESRQKTHSPYMFCDTGLPLLVKEAIGLRVVKRRAVCALVGGASVNSAKNFFHIGSDNVAAVEAFCRTEGLRIAYKDTGGHINRTVHFNVGTGRLTVKKPGGTDEIDLK